jgi:anti-sigma B factor antagonist
MTVNRSDMDNVTVLRLEGDIDDTGVDSLRTALYGCAKQNRVKLVLNMTEIRFVSYMGVGVLVERLQSLRKAGGDIKLVGLNLYTERLFRMVGVSALFDVHEDEAQAIGLYQQQAA